MTKAINSSTNCLLRLSQNALDLYRKLFSGLQIDCSFTLFSCWPHFSKTEATVVFL